VPWSVVTNEVRFPVYNPVDYTIHVIHCYHCVLGRQLIGLVGIAQLAHAVGKSIFCCEMWQCGSSQKILGMTCCQRWRISHGHNDNISETVLDRDVVTGHLTGSDTRMWPIQQQQL